MPRTSATTSTPARQRLAELCEEKLEGLPFLVGRTTSIVGYGRAMWAYQLDGPGRIRDVDCDPPNPADLRPGDLLLRFLVGGICGSDVPKFTGAAPADGHDQPGPGYPLHEIVAEVVASASARFRAGDRVVGVARGVQGLREYSVTSDFLVCAVPDQLPGQLPDRLPDLQAIAAQPLATVLSAVDRAPDVAGRTVAVLGLGPIGLLFAHVLKARGARSVVGVDPVDRTEVAADYGLDESVASTASAWVAGLADDDRVDLCVEAVGHQTATLADAVRAAAPGGHVLAFGVVDTEDHVVPFRTFFRKNLSMTAGTTPHDHWVPYLGRALELLAARPLPAYVTHALPVTEAQKAYDLAATPAPGRLKVAMTA
ncbi:zinc-binding dehydrogenase [Actinopolymorpha sp. B11F2]|uniref:zinc-dependent alcohol dehydrogenase n=1 Tax=Actinopolymorpha sp. B11F2 TaxID=3160862 RepID=UPI0032E48E99